MSESLREACAMFGHPSRYMESPTWATNTTALSLGLRTVKCACGEVERYVVVTAAPLAERSGARR